MTPQDMARLHHACFTAPRPWHAEEFADLLRQKTVFHEAMDQAGFLLGRVVADEAELLTLAVDPAARRRGYGRALTRAFETAAKRRGAARAFLDVACTNRAAIALYESQGYAPCAERPAYYQTPGGDPITALVMEKALAQA